MTKAFNTIGKFDEDSERCMPDYLTLNGGSNLVRFKEFVPPVGLQLPDTQRQAVAVNIDVEDDRIHQVALLQRFRWMLDPPLRNIRNVDQTIYTFFNFNKGTKVRQVTDATGYH